MILDSKLNIKKHILQKKDKPNREVLIIKELRLFLPCGLLLTLQKLESVQYDTALAMTNANIFDQRAWKLGS